MRRTIFCLCIVTFMIMAQQIGRAQVTVIGRGDQKTSIDLSALTTAASADARLFRKTLEADLKRSGWFTIVGQGRGALKLVGSCEAKGPQLHVKCHLFATANQHDYIRKIYKLDASKARRLAHVIADEIVYAVTGKKGIAATRIVMVGRRSKNKELYYCDADGGGLVRLTQDRAMCVSPRWGPEGQKIVYTSDRKGFPDIYLIDLARGKRDRVAHYSGLNMGGALSPDGNDLALILSKDGNPELYIKALGSGRLTRVTKTRRAAESSPSWSPDGRRIVYVSDRSGTPQLYMVSRSGGAPRRLTSRGAENVAPDWGPGGMLAFACRTGGKYHICIMNPDTMERKQITSDWADYEDPSWAPDGRHIVCSRTENYNSAIYILDIMGGRPIRLHAHKGDWYSPSWSPK